MRDAERSGGEEREGMEKKEVIIGAISHSFASELIFSSSSAVGHSSEPLKEQQQQQLSA